MTSLTPTNGVVLHSCGAKMLGFSRWSQHRRH